jgi:gallate dioxygenase
VRNVPPLPGAPELARSIATSLFAEEFDISFFRGKPVDHGCFSPLSMLANPDGTWPWKILPFQVGVLQFPIPTARRCYRLGGALGRAIRADPSDLRVVIVGTGGLSHQVHGERCGFNNPEWDHRFLDLLETDPGALTSLTHAEYAERGGFEGAEVIMWLIMRGALTDRIRRVQRTYYLPSMTAIATAIYENDGEYPAVAPFRDLQLEGIERLAGTYPYTLERSAKAYRLNRFLHDLIIPEHREAFRRNADALMTAHGLTAEEAQLVRRLDWRGLIHYGVIFFVLEKLAAVVGVSNPRVYAAMRGQSIEEFQTTRNAKIEYGVGVKRDG